MKKLRPMIKNWFDQLINQNVMRKKPKIITDKLKVKLINDIWKLFETEEEKEDWRKKKQNKKIIKDKIIADIRTLFEQEKEEDYYEHESNSDKNKNLSLDEYINKIQSYLRNIIIYVQYSDTWKIQLTIEINFISSEDSKEERVMYSSSDNIKFTSYSEVNDFIKKLFKSLRSKHQDGLETSKEVILFLIQFN